MHEVCCQHIFGCHVGAHTISETPHFAGENKLFYAKIVKFFTGPEMCLMCAQHKKFLSHFEVY